MSRGTQAVWLTNMITITFVSQALHRGWNETYVEQQVRHGESTDNVVGSSRDFTQVLISINIASAQCGPDGKMPP